MNIFSCITYAAKNNNHAKNSSWKKINHLFEDVILRVILWLNYNELHMILRTLKKIALINLHGHFIVCQVIVWWQYLSTEQKLQFSSNYLLYKNSSWPVQDLKN